MNESLRRHLGWVLGGVLVLGCVWIYRDITAFGFVGLDDDYNVIFNPHLGPLSWARVKWAFTDVEYTRRYVPLGWLGLSTVFGFAGLASGGYHAAALVLHCINALLVAAGLRALAERELGVERGAWRSVAVFLAAAFWAWHPLRVESVAWASGIVYEQGIALALAALWCQLRERRAAAVGCFTLALVTFPAALGLGAILVGLDARRWGWLDALKRNAGHVAAVVGVGLFNSLGRLWVVGTWPAAPTWVEFPWWQRVVQGLYVWAHYLWRPWWPVGLSPVDPVLLHPERPPVLVVVGAVAMVSLGAWLVFVPRARATFGWWVLVFCGVVVPVLGFWEKPHFPSDRYSHLPQLVMAGALVWWLARRVSSRAATAAVTVVLLGWFAILARQQTTLWTDEATMWRHITARLTVADSPVLACARPALAAFRAGDTAAALAMVEAGLRERPTDSALLAARAEIVQTEQHNRARAAALGLAKTPPPAAVLHHALAARLTLAGETEAAARHLGEVARLAPDYFERITRRAGPPSAR